MAATHPVGKFIDTSASYHYFDYTDGNTRNMVRLQGMYRIRRGAGKQMPIFRVGLSYLYDDGDFAALYYYIPLNYHHVQISADYAFCRREYPLRDLWQRSRDRPKRHRVADASIRPTPCTRSSTTS